MTLNEKQLFKLAHSLARMRNLLLALLALIILLMSDSINQYAYFSRILNNPDKLNRFSHPSIAQVVVLYLGIWTFVQSILLIYTWIPTKRFIAQKERRKSRKSRAENGADPSTTKSNQDSSGTVPV